MPVPVPVRPATAADAPAIAAIWHAGWGDGHLGNVPDELVPLRTAASFAERAGERWPDALVAEAGGEVAGFVIVTGDEVEQVYVAAAHRGSGLADALMDEAERRVRDGGHPSAWLAVVPGNGRARRFYERRGWVDTGPFVYEAFGPAGPVPVPARRYVKALAPRLTTPSPPGRRAAG
ncbi:MAG TPA: GNAT family N-acetyltransferase [Acidimicrobiales bacterium]